MEDKQSNRRSYSDAQASADLDAYYRLKRWVSVRSLCVGATVALLSAPRFPHPALALAAGTACGVANLWWASTSGERLLDRRHVGGFLISSFGRIAVFAIIPVAFGALGPWWSMAWYFAGFFLSLGMFAYGARRASTGDISRLSE